jgi:hypothetical protein
MVTQSLSISAIKNLPHGKELELILTRLHQNIPESISRGRNVTAGYTRGWGLEFGGLASSVANDPIYKESLELACGRTLLPEHKLMNLFLIIKYGMKNLVGDIVEFGCYKGGSAIFMANVVRRLGGSSIVYALDSFEGMPVTHKLLDLHSAGDFRNTSFSDLEAYARQIKLTNLVPVKGLFEQTFPSLLKKIKNIALAHVDCDIYSAVKYSISAAQSHMNSAGGYFVFDDPLQGSCIGALEATEDFVQEKGVRAEQAYPHLVYRFPKIFC